MGLAFLNFFGIVWFRKKISLPEKAANKELNIIGSMADEEITYFNGVEVGRTKVPGKLIYTVPAKLVQGSENIITIRLVVYRKYANIYREAERFSIAPYQAMLYHLQATGRLKRVIQLLQRFLLMHLMNQSCYCIVFKTFQKLFCYMFKLKVTLIFSTLLRIYELNKGLVQQHAKNILLKPFIL